MNIIYSRMFTVQIVINFKITENEKAKTYIRTIHTYGDFDLCRV